MQSPQTMEAQLAARLRVGSVLITKTGASYRVIEPLVQIAPNGGVVHALVVEKTARGGSPKSLVMPLGILTKLMRGGGRHRLGPGVAIDWSQVKRETMTKESTFLRGRRPEQGRAD